MEPHRRTDALRAAVAVAVALLAGVALACGGGDGGGEPAGGTSVPEAEATALSGADGDGGPPSDATAMIASGAVSGAVGAEVTAAIQALDVTAPGLGAWTLEISYDPNIISAVECVAQPPPAACNPRVDERTVRLAGAAATGLHGNVTLATITFRCEAAGTSPLEVTVELIADATLGDPRPISAAAQDGEVTCA